MPTERLRGPRLIFRPLVSERWPDFVRLFGERGACGGCWCMWWRLSAGEFEAGKGDRNRRAMKRIVESGRIPGIIAYSGSEPVGWCSIAPREEFPRLERSRILRPVDDKPVWSIVCLFIAKPYRKKGISVRLIRAAVEFARKRGARTVEGYAVEPRKGKTADTFAYHGPASAYRRAGFVEVARRSETRPIMRRKIRSQPGEE
jgi:GNAT superfamily N-acetyltransferase